MHLYVVLLFLSIVAGSRYSSFRSHEAGIVPPRNARKYNFSRCSYEKKKFPSSPLEIFVNRVSLCRVFFHNLYTRFVYMRARARTYHMSDAAILLEGAFGYLQG